MGKDNQTRVTEIELVGFSDFQSLQVLLFVLVFIFYVMALVGNTLILIITITDSVLQTPMYFFLRNLSFLEICYTSVTLPKMLVNLVSETQTISFASCGAQICFFVLFGITECCLLSVMAYDWYVAICHPLQYTLSMNQIVCAWMAAGSWIVGILVGFGHTISIFTLPFCGSNRINHFFCDVFPVLRLISTDTHKNEAAVTTTTVLFILAPFLLIPLSYGLHFYTILKMPSAEGRHKIFSTCSSHLIVVSLFYGTGTFIYMHPSSEQSQGCNRFLSLVYTVLTPTFKLIIYSLRNKEIRCALRKTIGRKMFPQVTSMG
ncbi:olfactory receptor 10A7-like [Gopherus flavomarginatus]|uniref:olfactory receptor 10A7-like n=1 Tax=Gopherus flavomarginatus TaxID=286002 RepID=UPI0021CBEDE0|nr:olfactory receptor 10A7-like [Gopherus flavomarginatus]